MYLNALLLTPMTSIQFLLLLNINANFDHCFRVPSEIVAISGTLTTQSYKRDCCMTRKGIANWCA
jgi:hypothetical protein